MLVWMDISGLVVYFVFSELLFGETGLEAFGRARLDVRAFVRLLTLINSDRAVIIVEVGYLFLAAWRSIGCVFLCTSHVERCQFCR